MEHQRYKKALDLDLLGTYNRLLADYLKSKCREEILEKTKQFKKIRFTETFPCLYSSFTEIQLILNY